MTWINLFTALVAANAATSIVIAAINYFIGKRASENSAKRLASYLAEYSARVSDNQKPEVKKTALKKAASPSRTVKE